PEGTEAMTFATADERQPYNDGHTHEALHVAYVLADMLDRHLLETRCAEQFPEVRRLIVTIAEQMGDLYQMIGTKFENYTPISPLHPWQKECPHCHADLRDGRFSRLVGIVDPDLDRLVAWQCPDCKTRWARLGSDPA